ncbi:MAG: hypothetical protein ABOK23_05405 [Candidatus Methanoperedens sp.]|nr:hypothetical protein [Candidatus Methanoperedens sp.]
MPIILEGAITIAGVALLALTFQILFHSRGESAKGIQTTDLMIRNICDRLNQSEQTRDDDILELICKLRRRKAHMQKDIQNFFALFVVASASLIIIGVSGYLGLDESNVLLIKTVAIWLFLFCFVYGIFFIYRLYLELHKIDMESKTT